MQSNIRRTLCVPAVLVFVGITEPACSVGDKKTTETEPTTTGMTTATTTATTPTGTDTGGVNCYLIKEETTCDETPMCTWPEEIAECIIDCAQIVDATLCNMTQFCGWSGDKCELSLPV